MVFERNGVTYVKRIAAVEGDPFLLLKFRQGGEELPLRNWEAEKLSRCFSKLIRPAGRLVRRRLPAGCCYVLSDRMAWSEDSRHFGPIALDQIRGKLLFAPSHEPELEMASASLEQQP